MTCNEPRRSDITYIKQYLASRMEPLTVSFVVALLFGFGVIINILIIQNKEESRLRRRRNHLYSDGFASRDEFSLFAGDENTAVHREPPPKYAPYADGELPPSYESVPSVVATPSAQHGW